MQIEGETEETVTDKYNICHTNCFFCFFFFLFFLSPKSIQMVPAAMKFKKKKQKQKKTKKQKQQQQKTNTTKQNKTKKNKHLLLGRKAITNLKSLFKSFTFTFSSGQSFSRVLLFATPWIAAHQASLSITNSRSSLKLMSTDSVMPSSHLILCCPLLLLPLIPPSIRIFSMSQLFAWSGRSIGVSALASVLPNKHPRLIPFRMDWLDLLAVQGTLKSLLQHHSSKASIIQHSAFFTLLCHQSPFSQSYGFSRSHLWMW